MGPIAALYTMTARQTLLNKRIWVAVFLMVLPCGLTMLLRKFAIDGAFGPDAWEMYHIPIQFVLITAVLPMVCMIYGTALIGSEIESRTIVYLLTRRMKRATVLLVRFAAVATVLAVLFDLAVVVHYFCSTLGWDPAVLDGATGPWARVSGWEPLADLLTYLWVVPIGVVTFLAVFTVVGFTSKPMSLSITYIVILELITGNLPFGVRVYTISHQLRASMVAAIPRLVEVYELPQAVVEAIYPPGQSRLLHLAIIVAIALVAACLVMTTRQLVGTRIARE